MTALRTYIPAFVTRAMRGEKTNWVQLLRSLGIPNATNRNAALSMKAAAADILATRGQVPAPRAVLSERGTPPAAVGTSRVEVPIEVANAARQT